MPQLFLLAQIMAVEASKLVDGRSIRGGGDGQMRRASHGRHCRHDGSIGARRRSIMASLCVRWRPLWCWLCRADAADQRCGEDVIPCSCPVPGKLHELGNGVTRPAMQSTNGAANIFRTHEPAPCKHRHLSISSSAPACLLF